MSELLTLFYRLPQPVIAQVFLLLSFWLTALWRRHGQTGWFRRSCGALLAAWAAVTLYATVLNRSGIQERMLFLRPLRFYWEPVFSGNYEVRRAAFMNVALFFPAGLLSAALLPRAWSGWKRLVLVTVLFLGISAAIEVSQYIWVLGEADVDDLLTNTLGAFLGALPIVQEDRLFGPDRQ